jgi:uncharacterized protein DUF3460
MNFIEKIFLFLAGRPGYESDHTRFMAKYLAEHPEEIESQRRGRAAWWDKTQEERAPAPAMHPTPRAGGNEATFAAPGEAED